MIVLSLQVLIHQTLSKTCRKTKRTKNLKVNQSHTVRTNTKLHSYTYKTLEFSTFYIFVRNFHPRFLLNLQVAARRMTLPLRLRLQT